MPGFTLADEMLAAIRRGEAAPRRPREREYTVWDNRVPSLGRVRRSGGKSYRLPEETGGRSNRAALGPVSTRSAEEARTECHGRQANPEPEMPARSARSLLMFREFVEGPWEDAQFDGYEPSTEDPVRGRAGSGSSHGHPLAGE